MDTEVVGVVVVDLVVVVVAVVVVVGAAAAGGCQWGRQVGALPVRDWRNGGESILCGTCLCWPKRLLRRRMKMRTSGDEG